MSTRRSAIGDNPLDSIIALPDRSEETPASQENGKTSAVGERTNGRAPERSVPARRPSPKPIVQGPKRTRLTVKVADEMVEELRDAVMFLHTKGVHTTLVGLIESAVQEELKRVKRKYNDGQDLPQRGADLPSGRPISA